MNATARMILTASALVALAVPAAAQEPPWVRDLEAHVERQAEAIARIVEAQVLRFAEAGGQTRDAEQLRRDLARERLAAQRERTRARVQSERERRSDNIRDWPEVTETISRSVRLARNGTFHLQNVAGEIAVTGAGGDDVRIAATKRARSPVEAQARTALQEIRIDISERGGYVEVRTDHPRRRNTVVAVDYTVSVPRGANVTLRTVSGNVRVTNLDGELRAESISGNVSTSSARRVRELRSVSGTLQMSGDETEELSASTISGDIVVRDLKVRVLDLHSVSGRLRLTDVETDRATLEAVSGGIDYSGRLSRTGRYDFQSHSGDIRITPASNQGFAIEAGTFSGTLRSDYALTLTPPTDAGRRRGPQRTIRGNFGDGGAVLTLQSFSGDIVIVKR